MGYPIWGQALNAGLNLISPAYRNSTNPTGSWGTKEFGVTEGVANTLSGGKTTDLSNAVDQVPGNLVRQVQQNPGQTLGANTVNNPQTTGGNPGNEIFNNQSENAKSQAQIELEQAMLEYDKYAADAQGQIGTLGTQRDQNITSLGTDYARSQQEGATAKEDATSATLSAQRKALGTAQGVQKSNRNVLRALGILSSSAAGEMLNKPMNEYGTQSAEMEQSLLKRKAAVDTWLAQRSQDFTAAKQQVETQFNDLIGKINTDLRFNNQQRQMATKTANAALNQRLADIQTSAAQYQQAAQQYNQNLAMQIVQMKLYQNPQQDISKLLSTGIMGVGGNTNTDTSVLPYQKKKTV